MLILFGISVSGQNPRNLREQKIMLDRDTIAVDSLSLIPGSFRLMQANGTVVDTSLYELDYLRALMIPSQNLRHDSAGYYISYRVFPLSLAKVYRHKDLSLLEPDDQGFVNPFAFSASGQKGNIFSTTGLNKSGSISRGVSFGNNQDVVVNSSFNLQLSGKLSRDIDIMAAITDNNVPIQPDGNTQTIQEFDKVFIQLAYKNARLIAGDFELTRPPGYFMNFYKKAQGGDFRNSFSLGSENKKNPWIMDIHAAGAVAKGKYARNRIQGEEGNQGPYKLRGNEGETFIMVLAASEKVFIDGILLTRGQDHDYTINYNNGEISFTPNILITREKRIVVEFEYAERNYARSMFFVSTGITNGKLNLRMNAFSEQDLKNQPLQYDLSGDQKAFLADIGDSLDKALWPNIDSAGFSGEEIRYRLTDTIVNNVYYDSVFIYSINPDSAVYKLGFGMVGEGRGNYILIKSDANGRVFEWVPPVDGIRQGKYEPVQILVTPRKTQMLTLGLDYDFNENNRFTSEISVSNNDINTFSDKDKADNTSHAMLLGYDRKNKLGSDTTNPWYLIGSARYEWVRKNFSPVEPYRKVEFNRDWNISHQMEEEYDQHMAGVVLGIENAGHGNVSYQLNILENGPLYSGIMNSLNGNMNVKGFFFNMDGSLLNTRQEEYNTRFYRSKSGMAKKLKHITLGVRQEWEYNNFVKNETDSLIPVSFSFNAWEAYIRNSDSAVNEYHAFYKQRMDKKPLGNELMAATFAREVGAGTTLKKNPSSRLTLTGTYRNLEVKNEAITDAKAEKVIVGRLEYFLKLFKGAVTFNTFYEVGAGQEQKQSFSYLKVPDGEGIYMWIDYNGDGVEQLNEFEMAPFRDQANYVRVFTQSNEYIKTYSNVFREALNLSPAAIWTGKEGFLKFMSRLSNQTMFRVEHKTSTEDLNIAYNPFIRESSIMDTSLISMNSSFRNTFYYNKTHPKFGMDFNYTRNRNKAFLVNGFETRTMTQGGINLRWNFYTDFILNLYGEKGNKAHISEFFSTRNFDINYRQAVPEIVYQPGTALRVSLKFRYENKKNAIAGERSLVRDLGAEVNYRLVNRNTLLVKANYINIDFTGDENSALGFEMLEGLGSGKNGTWHVSYQQNLSDYLQLSLIYDGRKPNDKPIVHVGSLQLRAYF
jgi:hypothetical protein